MKIQNIILFIGLGVITASCGVGKKDDRLVLHSESEEILTMRGYELSKIRLGSAIASQVDSVSEVYDINRISTWGLWDGITFSVKATSGIVYTELRCSATYDFVWEKGEMIDHINFGNCGNEKVRFIKTINISIPEVLGKLDRAIVMH